MDDLDHDVDLAIIGSGGAAFAAAIAARRKGRRVVRIERGRIGGTCMNTGCVPSKALLAAADAGDAIWPRSTRSSSA
jgi:mercuric reductase